MSFYYFDRPGNVFKNKKLSTMPPPSLDEMDLKLKQDAGELQKFYTDELENMERLECKLDEIRARAGQKVIR